MQDKAAPFPRSRCSRRGTAGSTAASFRPSPTWRPRHRPLTAVTASARGGRHLPARREGAAGNGSALRWRVRNGRARSVNKWTGERAHRLSPIREKTYPKAPVRAAAAGGFYAAGRGTSPRWELSSLPAVKRASSPGGTARS